MKARAFGTLIMPSALKQFYLDDTKLKQRAWLEFVRAIRTDRMIAFVSMATEAFGYGTWDQTSRRFACIAALAIHKGLRD